MMNKKLPGIVVTGASGFIGRHFVIAASEKFRLFCIAPRSQKEVGIPYHDNIHWLQVDITKGWLYIMDTENLVPELAGFIREVNAFNRWKRRIKTFTNSWDLGTNTWPHQSDIILENVHDIFESGSV